MDLDESLERILAARTRPQVQWFWDMHGLAFEWNSGSTFSSLEGGAAGSERRTVMQKILYVLLLCLCLLNMTEKSSVRRSVGMSQCMHAQAAANLPPQIAGLPPAVEVSAPVCAHQQTCVDRLLIVNATSTPLVSVSHA